MSVSVGGRTRSARLGKKELLVHGTSILVAVPSDLSRYGVVLALARHELSVDHVGELPAGAAEPVEALLPGPDLADPARAAFAWQDELLRALSSRNAG